MNPAGLIPLVLGMVLMALGISGRYQQAVDIVTGQTHPGTTTRSAAA